ncbi:MAG: phage-shock protein [Desulfobacterales bacterium]|nr:phage-shock protein [Desulfobacterales bacterium]
MDVFSILALIFGASILLLAVIGGTILLAIRIIKGGSSAQDRQQRADEARTIQEIYQGLSRMEDRVEALETILLDQEKKGSANESV